MPSAPRVVIHCVGGSGLDEGGEIEGVTGDRTIWLSLSLSSLPRTDVLSSSERVRASDEIRLRMKYGRPSSIMMLSVGVRKVGARMDLYIVPETTSAVLLLGEVGWTLWTSSD